MILGTRIQPAACFSQPAGGVREVMPDNNLIEQDRRDVNQRIAAMRNRVLGGT